MSTDKEKLEAIRHSVDVARKRMERLQILKEVSYLNKPDQYELDMCKELVSRGEKLLKDSK